MYQLGELTEDNLDAQLTELLAGRVTLVDPAVARWCEADRAERVARETDRRKLSKVDNLYENIYLLWTFINARSDMDEEGWAKVHQSELKGIVNKNSKLTELKRLFDAQGWADWRTGISQKMRLRITGDPVAVKLIHKSTDRILGKFTGREYACEVARKSLDHTEIDENESKSILREIYLGHIRRRDLLRGELTAFVPFTRDEELEWRKSESLDHYNRWMINKARRVSASVVNPVRQIRLGKGAVFRVPKKKGHRLFTPFAFLKRELRKAVRLDGERLACLDIRACHPSLLANKIGDSELLEDCLENRFYSRVSEYFEPLSPHPLTPDLTGDWTEAERQDIEEWWPKARTPPRERAKRVVMEYLFGPNQYAGVDEGKDQWIVQEFMAKTYPKTARFVWEQKEKRFYGSLAIDLQAAESKLFIDQFYCKDLREAGILGLTVHDAICVKASDAERVERSFRKRLKKEGLRVVLDTKYY